MVQLQKRIFEHRYAFSKLQKERLASKCIKPKVVTGRSVHVVEKEALGAKDHHEKIEKLFPCTYGRPRVQLVPGGEADVINHPLRIGCVLSGGQAPGGHNVIAGLYDFLKRCHPDSRLIGFRDGPHGVMNGIYMEIDDNLMDHYRNTGGFDMLGSGRHKIETAQQMADSKEVCEGLQLDGLVVIGGDDSNTNAALLAEYFEASGCKTKIAGCPKTIDGDLKNEYIPISFGFDTAVKTFSEEIGNVAMDAIATQKYYHFIRLMGRAASNIALECGLETRPNICLISEEVEEKGSSLTDITKEVAQMIVERSKTGKNYGVVMLPEGLIEFIPEFNKLISEINDVVAMGVEAEEESVAAALTPESRAVFHYLPVTIKVQLLLDRDPHGNVQVAKIETERLLAMTVGQELEKLEASGEYSGSFSPQFHSFGYEGRCAVPSHFDCSYCYTLGYTAGALIGKGHNGLMAYAQDLMSPIEEWSIGGVPITMMCHMERRKGKEKPVIKKALVDLEGAPFKAFTAQRDMWKVRDMYRAPGPIQFAGDCARAINMTLVYEQMGLEEGNKATGVALSETAVPKPEIVGSHKFLYRPSNEAIRSPLEQSRLKYVPNVPPSLRSKTVNGVRLIFDDQTQCSRASDREPIKRMFPHTYGSPLVQMEVDFHGLDPSVAGHSIRAGVVFCGRQAAGGHNIVWGLHEFLKGHKNKLVGFVGGSKGLFNQTYVEITDSLLDGYKNMGGFDLLGRTVDAVRTGEHIDLAQKACEHLKLDALVMIGGTRTNTDAAYLAEVFKARGLKTSVVGVPCTISGGMKNQFVEAAVGFDTATKVYAQLVGNTAIDGASARKYWYFMRLMGEDPSYIALETGLQTNPNIVLLAEEVTANRWSLNDIIRWISDVVQARAARSKNFGTVLVPEGLLNAIPEMRVLITEIDAIYLESGKTHLKVCEVQERLTTWSSALLGSLPAFIQHELCMERQSNKKVRLSQIQTEKMLVHFVEEELARRKKAGQYKGAFSAVCSYLGYQARSAMPSNFDCDYAFCLGGTAAALVHHNLSGYLATVTGLAEDVNKWKVGGVPLTALLVADDSEKMHTGHVRPIIPTGKVDLHGPSMAKFKQKAIKCEEGDMYRNPGPIQFAGDTADMRLMTLVMETQDYLGKLQRLREALEHIKLSCRPGCKAEMLSTCTLTLENLRQIMDMQEHMHES